MKPTDEELAAVASALTGVPYGLKTEVALKLWAVIAPLVLERAAKECDEVAAGHVMEERREAVEEMAEYIRILKDGQ
jgi:hypothetical protein